MATLLADVAVHVEGRVVWLSAGSELPVEFVGLVGAHVLDGDVPVADEEEAVKPRRGRKITN